MKDKKGRFSSFFAVSELPICEREKIEIFRVGKERKVLLSGVRRILLYSETEMRFALQNGRVSVLGQGLTCVGYEERRVAVSGTLLSVSFSEEDGK